MSHTHLPFYDELMHTNDSSTAGLTHSQSWRFRFTSDPGVFVVLVILLVSAVLVVLVTSSFLPATSIVSPHVLGQVILSSEPEMRSYKENK